MAKIFKKLSTSRSKMSHFRPKNCRRRGWTTALALWVFDQSQKTPIPEPPGHFIPETGAVPKNCPLKNDQKCHFWSFLGVIGLGSVSMAANLKTQRGGAVNRPTQIFAPKSAFMFQTKSASKSRLSLALRPSGRVDKNPHLFWSVKKGLKKLPRQPTKMTKNDPLKWVKTRRRSGINIPEWRSLLLQTEPSTVFLSKRSKNHLDVDRKNENLNFH